jgi:hypothetical protein
VVWTDVYWLDVVVGCHTLVVLTVSLYLAEVAHHLEPIRSLLFTELKLLVLFEHVCLQEVALSVLNWILVV